jgi:hypothetical protein
MYHAGKEQEYVLKLSPWNFGGRGNLWDLGIDGRMRSDFIIVINETSREKLELIHLVQYGTYDDLQTAR